MIKSNKPFIAKLLQHALDTLNNPDAEIDDEELEQTLECAKSLANYYSLDTSFAEESLLTVDDSIDAIKEQVEELCCPVLYQNRSQDEINDYLDEAFDKVWYCRTQVCDIPEMEQKRLEMVKRLKAKYGTELDELKDSIHSDWNYGYWSGILGALRWAVGEEKDFLDT